MQTTRERSAQSETDHLRDAARITVTDEERRRGSLEPGNLERALAVFREYGFVVVEGALSADRVAEVRAHYLRDLAAKIERSSIRPVTRDDPRRHGGIGALSSDFVPEGGNHDFNRWNMQLPSRRPYLDGQVVANPFVQPVVDGIL